MQAKQPIKTFSRGVFSCRSNLLRKLGWYICIVITGTRSQVISCIKQIRDIMRGPVSINYSSSPSRCPRLGQFNHHFPVRFYSDPSRHLIYRMHMRGPNIKRYLSNGFVTSYYVIPLYLDIPTTTQVTHSPATGHVQPRNFQIVVL
jgi:hypothetical protein